MTLPATWADNIFESLQRNEIHKKRNFSTAKTAERNGKSKIFSFCRLCYYYAIIMTLK